MKWHTVVAVLRPVVLPVVAGLIAGQLVLAGLPEECAAQVRGVLVRLFD